MKIPVTFLFSFGVSIRVLQVSPLFSVCVEWVFFFYIKKIFDLSYVAKYYSWCSEAHLQCCLAQMLISLLCAFVRAVCAENQTSDQALSSPSSLGSPGLGMEGLNRRRKKRTSIETNIRVALEKSFLEVSDISHQTLFDEPLLMFYWRKIFHLFLVTVWWKNLINCKLVFINNTINIFCYSVYSFLLNIININIFCHL